MEGFANFLMIFAQRYFYPCWNKIGTKNKTKQNKKKQKQKTTTKTNKQTKQKTPFWRFLKNVVSNKNLTI